MEDLTGRDPTPDADLEPNEKTSKAKGVRRSPRTRTLIYTGFGGFLLFLFALTLFFYYNFKTIEVQGDSMAPTLYPGQRLLISKAYWLVGDIKKNDIVVINNMHEDEVIIKRVYKVSGQKVNLHNVPQSWDLAQGDYVVPAGTVFVLGDNYEVSQDSRHYGAFDVEDVIGKVVVINSAVSKPDEAGT